nr:lignin-forming anionic peroxidase [Quercus suber]
MRNSFISHASTATVVFMLLLLSTTCKAQLSSTFYDQNCPNGLSTIRNAIRTAVSRERRMAASLIRLHFHDCFVQGCDASILLEDGERNAVQNKGSARGYEVIDSAKAQVEKICPGVVSCADILAVAARDASVAVGGPSWTVKLGRRDSTTASSSLAEQELPRFTDGLDSLISRFGSHTLGQAQCSSFRGRIYNNGSDIDVGFASTRKRRCPDTSGQLGDSNLAPLDLVTPNSFDNNYFKNLLQKKGLLQSDQILFSGGSTDNIVSEYSRSPATFKSDFASAMIKMGDIGPLTGSASQIRRICCAIN